MCMFFYFLILEMCFYIKVLIVVSICNVLQKNNCKNETSIRSIPSISSDLKGRDKTYNGKNYYRLL